MKESRTVYINGRFTTQRVTGVQRYAWELLNALDLLLGEGYDITAILLVPPGASTLRFHNIVTMQKGKLTGHLWEQFELPRLARNGLLFNPCGAAPLFHGPQITTVHDAALKDAPEGYGRVFRLWYSRALAHTCRTSKKILTVSNFSKKQIAQQFRINPSKIVTTTLGHEHILRGDPDAAILDDYGLVPRSYVLAIGSANPNKNFHLFSEAALQAKILPLKWVTAGGTDPRIFGHNHETGDHIVKLGYISDFQLAALYRSALCFVFPSRYEGFGLPALEAMTYGCPVIVSRQGALEEVCGDAALYIDPNSAPDLIQQVTALYSSDSLWREMSRRGYDRARQFSWEKTAAIVLDTFNELLSNPAELGDRG